MRWGGRRQGGAAAGTPPARPARQPAASCGVGQDVATASAAAVAWLPPHITWPPPPPPPVAGAHHVAGQEPQLHLLWHHPAVGEGPLLGGAQGHGQGHQQDCHHRWAAAAGQGADWGVVPCFHP